MFKDGGTILLCCAGIGQNRTGGVDIAFTVGPQPAKDAICRQYRTHLTGFFRGHKPDILDADALIDAVGRLQPFPAIRRTGQRQASGHMHANRLAAFLFNFAEKVNRVGLQRRNVRIGIQRMDTARRMPARPSRQDRPFDQRDIRPTHL